MRLSCGVVVVEKSVCIVSIEELQIQRVVTEVFYWGSG
jgi:hypothetical protein